MMAGTAGPVTVIVLIIIAVWYAAVVWMNAPWAIDQYGRQKVEWTTTQLLKDTMNQKRPVLPAPHQIAGEINKTVFQMEPQSKRSLIFHAKVTLRATLWGFLFGSLLGILIAVGIVHMKVLDKSLMPWVIASQTIPILAIAPMVIVVLGAMGSRGIIPKVMAKGVIPKATISAYLSFFPVTIGMVKGLRSPDPLQLDLMRTYSANRWQTFWKLRWPSSVPYLFTSLKVSIAISMVGAIVAELSAGTEGGLGVRLLAGSYYGQTLQIWAALIVAAVLAASLVALVSLIEKLTLKRMGVTS